MSDDRFQRGRRPGLWKKWTPSTKIPEATLLRSVFGFTRNSAAASAVVRYSKAALTLRHPSSPRTIGSWRRLVPYLRWVAWTPLSDRFVVGSAVFYAGGGGGRLAVLLLIRHRLQGAFSEHVRPAKLL
jgi:hypothetical protein